MSAIIEVKYYNTYLLKKIDAVVTNSESINTYPYEGLEDGISGSEHDWVIEESRIRGGFNNTSVDFGVRAYTTETDYGAKYRKNAIIFSGVYNKRTASNKSNQFSIGEDIIRAVDPKYGSIQLLYAEDNALIIFQEDKVNRALIDKDIIYTAEGGQISSLGNTVMSQINQYAGEYGISTNPESFAVYGNRKYFADRKRNAILRLSADGITEISNYGMYDFFRDELSALDDKSKIVGGYDTHTKKYDISILKDGRYKTSPTYKTIGFDDAINGWISFYTYAPNFIGSINGKFYSTKGGLLYEHYKGTQYSNFYGSINGVSTVKLVMNGNPSQNKTFRTLNYEGDSGWYADSIITDTDTGRKIEKYSGENRSQAEADSKMFKSIFTKKDNKYYSNIFNTSTRKNNNVLSPTSISGINGYYAIVDMKVVPSANKSELFAVSAEIK